MASISSNLFCCLCSFVALTDSELEMHIDQQHSDIFVQDESNCQTDSSATKATQRVTISDQNKIKESRTKVTSRPRKSLPTKTESAASAAAAKTPATLGRKDKTAVVKTEPNVGKFVAKIDHVPANELSSGRGKKRAGDENIDPDSSFGALKVKRVQRPLDSASTDEVKSSISRSSEFAPSQFGVDDEKERFEAIKRKEQGEPKPSPRHHSKNEEFENVKKQLKNAMKTINSKNAEIGALKLTEKRLVQDNNTMYKEMKKMRESTDAIVNKFEVLRASLKKVREIDDEFCKNGKWADGTWSGTDAEVYELFNHVVNAYVETRRRHLTDFQSFNEKLKITQNERDKLQASLDKLAEKVKAKDEAFDIVIKGNKRLEKESIRNQKDLQSALDTIKQKDEKIRKLQDDLKALKDASGQYHHQISILRDEIRLKNKTIAGLQSNKSNGVVRLEKQMEKKEKEYRVISQKYRSGMDALKAQVKKTFKDKEDQIERLSEKLKSAERMLAMAKQLLCQQKEELETLGRRSKLADMGDLKTWLECGTEAAPIKREVIDVAIPSRNAVDDTNTPLDNKSRNVDAAILKPLTDDALVEDQAEISGEATAQIVKAEAKVSAAETEEDEVNVTQHEILPDVQTKDSARMPTAEPLVEVPVGDTSLAPAQKVDEEPRVEAEDGDGRTSTHEGLTEVQADDANIASAAAVSDGQQPGVASLECAGDEAKFSDANNAVENEKMETLAGDESNVEDVDMVHDETLPKGGIDATGEVAVNEETISEFTEKVSDANEEDERIERAEIAEPNFPMEAQLDDPVSTERTLAASTSLDITNQVEQLQKESSNEP